MREKRKPQIWWSLLTFIARVSRVGAQRLTRGVGGEGQEDREDHEVLEEAADRGGGEVVDQGAEGQRYLADQGVADPAVEDPGVAVPGAAVRGGAGRVVDDASSLLLLQGCCGVAKGLEGASQFIMQGVCEKWEMR
ncbi:hypothetical protein PVL29_014470 [Vitis rotundifolia]|uniref:Uncharacterized protein n=1 Tax=Vitis rotundifolia TaxID=103349 RepID=A0AA38ZHC7_VITRO|nr:hypothetical protein PVL29_014470 [Vitis rotundifolia]